MARSRALLIGMGAVIAILAAASAFVLGHRSAPVENRMAAPVQAPAKAAALAPPRPADPDEALGRWLAGGWAEELAGCRTDTGDYYDRGGRYGAAGREGIWRIEDGVLVVTITHEAVGDPMAHEYIGLPAPETARYRVTRLGPDRMIQVVDGRPVRMMRCPSARHSFAT